MCKIQSYVACQRSTSGKWVGSGGRSEAVGATLRGELGAEVVSLHKHLKHCLFCSNKVMVPILTYFLIPLVKVLLLTT